MKMAINLQVLLGAQELISKQASSKPGKTGVNQGQGFSNALDKALVHLKDGQVSQQSAKAPDDFVLNSLALFQFQSTAKNSQGETSELVTKTGELIDLGKELTELLDQLEEIVNILGEQAELQQLDTDVSGEEDVAVLATMLADLLKFLQKLIGELQPEAKVNVEVNADEYVQVHPSSSIPVEQKSEAGRRLPLAGSGDSVISPAQILQTVSDTNQTTSVRSDSTSEPKHATQTVTIQSQLVALAENARDLEQRLGNHAIKVPQAVAVLLRNITEKLSRVEQTLTAEYIAKGETSAKEVPEAQVPATTEEVPLVQSGPSSQPKPETKAQVARDQSVLTDESSTKLDFSQDVAAEVTELPEESVLDLALDAKEFKPLLHRIQQLQQVLEHQQEQRPVFNQIVERVQLMVADKQSTMELQLRPEHLGRLSLKVSVEQGIVKAHFVAESQQVRQLLEGNLTNLKHSLTNLGMAIDEVTVTVAQGETYSQRERQDQQQWTSQQRRSNLASEEDVVFEVSEYGAELDENSTIDYKV